MITFLNNLLSGVLTKLFAPPWVLDVALMVINGVVMLVTVLVLVLVIFFLDLRKLSARFQCRLGPMRVAWPRNFHGWAQPIADGLKLLIKEDVIPAVADRWVFTLAPIIVFIPAFLLYVVVPFSDKWVVKNLNIGILYVVSISSLFVIGIIMAGWGGNNKYSLYGAYRSAAQLVSYEVPMVLSIVVVLMLAGSLSTVQIVEQQRGTGILGFLNWNAFRYPPFGFFTFLVFMTAAMAEVNRVPFDIPEAESELVAGFHTEYSGMKFALFFLSEYAEMIASTAILVTLFLGGWHSPFGTGSSALWFFFKLFAVIFLLIWIRWTYPRVRVDQLMDIGWKFLVPVALFNIMAVGAWMAFWG